MHELDLRPCPLCTSAPCGRTASASPRFEKATRAHVIVHAVRCGQLTMCFDDNGGDGRRTKLRRRLPLPTRGCTHHGSRHGGSARPELEKRATAARRSIWAPSSGALPEGGHDGFRGGASGIQRAPRISPWRVGSGATVRGRERRESACCSPGGQRGPQRFVGSSRRNRARSLSKGIDARPLSFRRSVSARGWADQAAVRGSRTAPPRRSRPPDR